MLVAVSKQMINSATLYRGLAPGRNRSSQTPLNNPQPHLVSAVAAGFSGCLTMRSLLSLPVATTASGSSTTGIWSRRWWIYQSSQLSSDFHGAGPCQPVPCSRQPLPHLSPDFHGAGPCPPVPSSRQPLPHLSLELPASRSSASQPTNTCTSQMVTEEGPERRVSN